MQRKLTDILEKRREYSGAEINAAGLGWLVKLTNESEYHHGVQYTTGPNVDPVCFAPRNKCSTGGLYFCRAQDAPRFFSYGAYEMEYVRTVTLPDDARVYVEKDKMKADKLVLGERQTIRTCANLFRCVIEAGTMDDRNVFDASFYTDDVWRKLIATNNKHTDKALESLYWYKFNEMPAALKTPEMLNAAAARNLFVRDLPKEQRTRAMLDAALSFVPTTMYGGIYGRIIDYFPTDMVNDDDRAAMVPMGFPIADVPKEKRTRAVFEHLIRSPFLRRYSIAELKDCFDASFFTPKTYETLAGNANYCIENVPGEYRTRAALLESMTQRDQVGKRTLANHVYNFPASAFTSEICDTLLLTMRMSVRCIPASFRTRALFDEMIRRDRIDCLGYFNDSFCDAAATALLIQRLRRGGVSDLDDGLPRSMETPEVINSLIEQKRWKDIRYLRGHLDQKTYDQMFANGCNTQDMFAYIPMYCRTNAMYRSMYERGEIALEHLPDKLCLEIEAKQSKRHANPPSSGIKRKKRHDWSAKSRKNVRT